MVVESQKTPGRERPGCVLGIAFGLLVLGSIVAWIVLPKTEPRDGAQLFQTWFGAAVLPGDYAIRDAAKLMGGEEVVQCLDNTAEPERARIAVQSKAKGDESKVDWERIDKGPVDRWPRALVFVSYPKDRAQKELNRLFDAKLSVGSFAEVPSKGGRMVLELGTLAVGERFLAYVVEREFEPGGTFKDVARLNLSKPEDALIVNAAWSRSEPYSKPRLQELAQALAERP